MLNRIPILPDLMTPNHRRHPIRLTPPLSHIRSKSNPHTPLTRSPPLILLRISPQQLAHQPLLTGLFPVPIDLAHVVERYAVFREETAMNDKVSFCAGRGEEGRSGAFGFGVGGRLGGFEETGHGEGGEDVGEQLVCHLAVLGFALALSPQIASASYPISSLLSHTHLKPINLVHITSLMIPPVQPDPVRVQPLVREQRQRHLDGP